ncbi:MAG: response regulator [Deltaproteobacteria bacterium]|nr:response regulator [Deltaproteobacteria bacterium]
MGSVLIVDDDDSIRQCFHDLLTREGHRALVWPGSTDVDQVIGRMHPDVVITDHNLNPGEEKGLDLAARLVASGQKAVLMSSDETLERLALSRGVPFYYKLAPLEQLFAMVDMAGRG